jgi:hypothetical protein
VVATSYNYFGGFTTHIQIEDYVVYIVFCWVLTPAPCSFVGVVFCLVENQEKKQGAPLITGKIKKLLIADVLMILGFISSYVL